MMSRFEPAVLITWTMATAAVSLADVHHPIRTVIVMVFLAFVPGLAIVRFARIGGYGVRLLLALPTSLSLAAVVSAVLVYSGVPTWDLGLAALLSVTVGFVLLDVARPSILREQSVVRRKLDDESRQAALLQTLIDGGSMSDAARAAGVSPATLRRALQRSNRLRLAVSVATHRQSESPDFSEPDQRTFGEHPGRA
jgi:hypothetical protein